jgi:outer membrane protein TolC
MNLMLGLPEQTEIIPDSSSIQISADEKSIDVWEQLAFQNRKDITALTFRKKSAGLAIKSAKGEKYPSIALTGGYIAAHIPNFLTVTNAMNVGIGIQYNLSFWKSNTGMQQARSRSLQLQENEALLSNGIRLQINQAYQDYLLSRKKIDVLQEAVEQAAENYKITKNKYENSLATTTDLLDADVAQLQSKLNFAFAKVDAVVAYNRLLQSAGVLYSTTGNK